MEVTVADRNVSPKDTEEEAIEFDVQCAVEEEDNGMDTPRPIHIGIQKLWKATKSFYFQVEQSTLII